MIAIALRDAVRYLTNIVRRILFGCELAFSAVPSNKYFFVFLSTLCLSTAYAGTVTTYDFNSSSGGPGNPAIIQATGVTSTNGGTLTIYAFDIDNPDRSSATEQVKVYVSYNGGSTWSSALAWDSYQLATRDSSGSALTWSNYVNKGIAAEYGSKIYDARASTVNNNSSETCYNSFQCLIGSEAGYTKAVFTIPDFTNQSGFSGTLKIKFEQTNYVGNYAGFYIDAAKLSTYTNTLPTSGNNTVSTQDKYTFTLTDFTFSDANTATDGDKLEYIKITGLPTSGEIGRAHV